MKEQMKYVITFDIILIIFSLFSLLCPLLKITNLRNILLCLLICFGFISAFKFIFKKCYRDFEPMYQAIASLVFSLIIYFVKIDDIKKLAFLFLIWIFTIGLTKLIKCDYYHDLKNPLWISKMIGLIIYMMTGLVCSLNFGHGNIVSIFIISFYFLISHIIDLLHDLFESLGD